MKPTGIDKLKGYAAGEVVELPPFVGDEPFVVRLKRPSLMGLVTNGKIPNGLMKVAAKLFMGETGDSSDGFMGQCEIFQAVAKEALVEPSYAQIEEAGLELTDMQLMSIFNYTQIGSKALEPFRTVGTASSRPADKRTV